MQSIYVALIFSLTVSSAITQDVPAPTGGCPTQVCAPFTPIEITPELDTAASKTWIVAYISKARDASAAGSPKTETPTTTETPTEAPCTSGQNTCSILNISSTCGPVAYCLATDDTLKIVSYDSATDTVLIIEETEVLNQDTITSKHTVTKVSTRDASGTDTPVDPIPESIAKEQDLTFAVLGTDQFQNFAIHTVCPVDSLSNEVIVFISYSVEAIKGDLSAFDAQINEILAQNNIDDLTVTDKWNPIPITEISIDISTVIPDLAGALGGSATPTP